MTRKKRYLSVTALLLILALAVGVWTPLSSAAEPVLKADGWYYADTLPAGITAAQYTIQYCSYYDKVATKSPGTGWVKGAVAKTTYANKDDAYWSMLDLELSDTLVLVDSYYYHYCGEDAQGHANYYATEDFPHYDKVSKTSYKPDKGHADNEDPRYRYYVLKNSKGSKYYCKRGTTCKSNTDIHGKRCCYWYRASKYQEKTKTVYYTYSKTAGWTAAPDAKADRTEVRYRPLVTTQPSDSTVPSATASSTAAAT